MNLYVFTDYACPFCYIAYKICKKVEKETGCVFWPVYMEIHPDLPAQGAQSIHLFSDKRREQINRQLKQLGQPYGIEPQIGARLSSSKKAITLRAYVTQHYPEKTQSYDDRIYELYHAKISDIGDDVVLGRVCQALEIPEFLETMLGNFGAKQKLEDDKRWAGMNFIHITPTFIISCQEFPGESAGRPAHPHSSRGDEKRHEGILQEQALAALILEAQ